MTTPDSIRLYPGLLAPAVRTGHAGGLALWTLARAVDGAGSGWVIGN